MVACPEVHATHQDVATSKKGGVIKINFMSGARNSRETDGHQGGGRPAHGILR